jgi:hypothetical protein
MDPKKHFTEFLKQREEKYKHIWDDTIAAAHEVESNWLDVWGLETCYLRKGLERRESALEERAEDGFQ